MNRDEIDALFGSEATDKNLAHMSKHWTIKDVKQYLTETGYSQDHDDVDFYANEIYRWLKNFKA